MVALKNIAVLGATGNVGEPIVKALIERKKEFDSISAITSSDPTSSKFSFLKKEGVKVEKADLEDKASLVSSFRGKDAVIIALGGAAASTEKQIRIIDAAIEAGVKRVYPSEFGFDYSRPNNKVNPAIADKLVVRDYLEKKAQEGKISYTWVVTGSFVDFTLVTSFLGLNLKSKTAELINGGKDDMEFTTTQDIGRFVAATLVRADASNNKTIRVRSFRSNTASLLSLLEKYYNTKFQILSDKTYEKLQEEKEQLKQKGDAHAAIINVWNLHFGGNGTYEPIDNHLFPEVSPTPLETAVKDVVDGLANGKYAHFQDFKSHE